MFALWAFGIRTRSPKHLRLFTVRVLFVATVYRCICRVSFCVAFVSCVGMVIIQWWWQHSANDLSWFLHGQLSFICTYFNQCLFVSYYIQYSSVLNFCPWLSCSISPLILIITPSLSSFCLSFSFLCLQLPCPPPLSPFFLLTLCCHASLRLLSDLCGV